MQKEQLESLCKLGVSQKKIGEHLGINQSTVSYWLKQYGLFNKNEFYICNKAIRFCPSCSTNKPIKDFYKRHKESGCSTYCKLCTQDRVNNNQRNFKQKCVEYKGGKCQICGYAKYMSALEFHHRNPKEKDFTISQRTLVDFKKHKKELDKCDLLCCRCHREIHEELN